MIDQDGPTTHFVVKGEGERPTAFKLHSNEVMEEELFLCSKGIYKIILLDVLEAHHVKFCSVGAVQQGAHL